MRYERQHAWATRDALAYVLEMQKIDQKTIQFDTIVCVFLLSFSNPSRMDLIVCFLSRFLFAILYAFSRPLGQAQAMWMILSIAYEDVETQRKGLVFLSCNIGGNLIPNRKLVLEYGRIHHAFPVRLASHHAIVNDLLVEAAMNFCVHLIGSNVSIRHRCHRGSPMEVQYKLLTFGIPSHLNPINLATGECDVSFHRDFIRKRWIQESLLESSSSSAPSSVLASTMEGDPSAPGEDEEVAAMDIQQSSPTSMIPTLDPDMVWVDSSPSHLGLDRIETSSPVQIVTIPKKSDICFGRGKGIMKYPGNLHFRKVIEERLEAYDQTYTKGGKSDLIREVVIELSRSGSRFLKQDGQGQVWMTVGFKESCSKVSHAFRNQKRSTSSCSSRKNEVH
jgi:hypothetical protein